MKTITLKLRVYGDDSQVDVVEKVDAAKLKGWLAEGDGHTVYSPEKFTEIGFSEQYVLRFNEEQGAGATRPQDAIFDKKTGKAVVIVAVYGLRVMRNIASAYGVTSEKLGRGSEARDLGEKLIKKLRLK